MKIELIRGDITKITVDVIVNAANTSLLGGGGVDGAIHRAGGKAILEECLAIRNRQGDCPVGEAVITTAGNLPAIKLIHTVGPRWNGGSSGEANKLRNCYLNSLRLADKEGFSTIVFPNISTGIYRFPKEQAAMIALASIKSFQPNSLTKVLLVCFDEENYQIYQERLEK
ncbi:MAG: O-acetyl-ADP-ribose deacetylase [Bacteroidota bacterium]